MTKHFEAVIAGGGLIGGAIALELASAGVRVAIFEQGEPGREASWAGAGILSPAPENPATIPLVPLGKASMALYPEFVASVEEISGQNVGFRAKGTLEALFSRDAARELSTHVALYHGWGLKAEAVSAEDARELEPALSPELEAGNPLTVEVDVKNASTRAADEVVELYVSFPKLPGTPLRALRGFDRVHLDAGEVRHVKLALQPRDLSYVNEAGDRMVAAGDYVITAGGGQPGTAAVHADARLSIHGEQKLPE